MNPVTSTRLATEKSALLSKLANESGPSSGTIPVWSDCGGMRKLELGVAVRVKSDMQT